MRYGLIISLLLIIGLAPLPVFALVNGGFEAGLAGWTVFPSTGVNPIRATAEPAGFGVIPTEGRLQGVIETSDVDGRTAAEMETFFGLTPGAIAGFGQSNPRGIAIGQTLDVAPGDTLLGDIDFLTNELVEGDPGYTTDPAFDDFAVLIADGAAYILADVNLPGFFTSGAQLRGGSSVTGVTKETGYQPLSYAFQNPGLQTVGFAVFNVSDIGNQSALAIDDLRVEPVPLPRTFVLAMAWIGLLVILRRGNAKRHSFTLHKNGSAVDP